MKRTPAIPALRIVCLAAAVVGGAFGQASAQERYALIVSGAAGGATYRENYDRWRTALVLTLRDRFRLHEEHITVLGERSSAGVAVASRENLQKAVAALREKMTATDQLLIVLIGHGTFDGTDAKFNLVGPDLDAGQWKEMLAGIAGRLVIVNTTSASFPFLQALSGRNRVVITATDSTAQRYATVFPEAFLGALDAAASDLDKNERISVWEAFTAASAKVKEWYEQRGQLATERALLDDDGDGVGKEAGAPGPDGELAKRTYFDAEVMPDITADPALGELVKRRAELEAQVEELRSNRGSMPPEEYQKKLEELLLELARVSREIRQKS
jgi:hypothetical protein